VEGLSGPSVCRRPREDMASMRRRALTSDCAAPRGTVGIDIAGPRPDGDRRFPYRELRPLVQQASDAGLGVTIHVGEEDGAYGIAEIREVVSTLRPDRIGHGILAAKDAKLMAQIGEAEIVLEICPTSSLLTKALPDEEAARDTSVPSPGMGCRSRSPPTARR
jgi:adenosine deaminase